MQPSQSITGCCEPWHVWFSAREPVLREVRIGHTWAAALIGVGVLRAPLVNDATEVVVE